MEQSLARAAPRDPTNEPRFGQRSGEVLGRSLKVGSHELWRASRTARHQVLLKAYLQTQGHVSRAEGATVQTHQPFAGIL